MPDSKPLREAADRRIPIVFAIALLLALVAACAAPGGSPDTTAATAPSPAVPAVPHTPYLPLPAAANLATEIGDGQYVDPVLVLQDMLESGEVELTYDSVVGYLPALLAALDIPVSSQSLVFSRTSLQARAISPWSPRAVYFNDDVYIGYVVDSEILEVASIDPDDGAIFYTLAQDEGAPPAFQEDRSCLGCHERKITLDVPGVMVRSTFVDRQGWTVQPFSEEAIVDRTPMEERFAGFYVTGTMARGAHAGNTRSDREVHELGQQDFQAFDFTTASDVQRLPPPFVEREVYLSDHSDIVGLLVMAHQTRLHNVIAYLHEGVKEAMRNQRAAVVSTGAAVPESGLLPATETAIASKVDRLVREMFFAHEADIGGPIVGTSGFAEEFTARGPADSMGRSLRDFDLDRRLFQYPLSFIVYTDAFDALPGPVAARVYDGIEAVLSGADTRDDFSHLDAATRTAIREILIETKPAFAAHLAGR